MDERVGRGPLTRKNLTRINRDRVEEEKRAEMRQAADSDVFREIDFGAAGLGQRFSLLVKTALVPFH